MLRLVYDCIPRDPNVRVLMEQHNFTHLSKLKPSSLEFVIREAVKELGGIL